MLKWVTGRYKSPSAETVADYSGDEYPPSENRRLSKDSEERNRERRKSEKEIEIKSTVSGRSSKSSHSSRRGTGDEMSREEKERRRKERAERRNKDSASSVTSELTSVSRVSRRSGQMVVKLPEELPVAPLSVEPLAVTGRKRSPTMPTNLRSIASEERDSCCALSDSTEKSRLLTKRASDTALHSVPKIDSPGASFVSRRDDIQASPRLQSTFTPTLTAIPTSAGLSPHSDASTASPRLPHRYSLPIHAPATFPCTAGSKTLLDNCHSLPPTKIAEGEHLKHSEALSGEVMRRTHKPHIRSNSEVRFASSVTDGAGTPRSGFKYPPHPHYPEPEYFPSQPPPREHYHQESTHKAELPPRPEYIYWQQQRPQSAAGYYGYHQQAYSVYPQNYPLPQQSAMTGLPSPPELLKVQQSDRENSGRSILRHSLPPPQTSHHDFYPGIYQQYQMQPFTPQPQPQALAHHVPRYPPPPLPPPSADVEAVAHKRPERKRRHSVHHPSSYEPSYVNYQFQRGLIPVKSDSPTSKLPYDFPPTSSSRRSQPTRLSLSSKKSYRPPALPEFTPVGSRNFFMPMKPEQDEQREDYAPEAFENETTVTSMVAVSSGHPTREARLPVGRLVRKRPSGDKSMNSELHTTQAEVVAGVALPVSPATEFLPRPVLPPTEYCAAISVFGGDDIEGQVTEGITKDQNGDKSQLQDVTKAPLHEPACALNVGEGTLQEEVEEAPTEKGEDFEEEGVEEAKERNNDVEVRQRVEEDEEDHMTAEVVDRDLEREDPQNMVKEEDNALALDIGGMEVNDREGIVQEGQTSSEQADDEGDEEDEEDEEAEEDKDEQEEEDRQGEEIGEHTEQEVVVDEEPDGENNSDYTSNLAYSTHVKSHMGLNLEEPHDQTQERFLANLDLSSVPPSSLFSTASKAPTVITTADLDSMFPSTAESSTSSVTHASTILSTPGTDFSSNVSTASSSYASSHPNKRMHAPFTFASPPNGIYTPSTGSSTTTQYPIRNPLSLTEHAPGGVISHLFQRVPIPSASLPVTTPQAFPRFTNLNLRLLRHLEAELVELERMLEECETQIENNGSEIIDSPQQYYDNTQVHASPKEYTYSPAGSLRSLFSRGFSSSEHSELRSKRAELMDVLAWKLGQYNQALLNYRNMTEAFGPVVKPCSTRRPGSRDSGVASSRGSSGVRLPEHLVSGYSFENASSDHIPGDWGKLASGFSNRQSSQNTVEGGMGGHKNEHPEEFEVKPTQERSSEGGDCVRSIRSSSFAKSLFPLSHPAIARLPDQISAKLQSINPPPTLFLAALIATCLLAAVWVMSRGWLVVFCIAGGLEAGRSGKWLASRIGVEAEMDEDKSEEEQRGRSGRPALNVVVGPAANDERFPGAFPE